MDKYHLFYIVYGKTKNKYPKWSSRRVRSTALWYMKKAK